MNLNPFSSPLGGTEAKLNAQDGFIGGTTAMLILGFVLNYLGTIDLFPN